MAKSVAIIGSRGYPSYYGGFETLIRNLAPYLYENGWDVSVYGRPQAIRNDDPDRVGEVRSVITRGVETKSLSTLSYGLTSTLHATFHRPDVALVLNVANGYWLPFLKARGIPTLVNVDGMEWERQKWGKAARGVFKLGAIATAKFADNLVFDSREIARRWNDELHRVGDFIPYGGVEMIPRTPSFSEDLSPRTYALMVARFVPENTVAEFFEAAKIIAQKWDVAIVGSSGYGGEFDDCARELARNHPRIKWYGHVNDDDKLFNLWRNAGVYFHGHSVGGTNPALVQAMACSAPIVARDTPYNREVLGDAGLFVSPRETEIAETLLKVLEDSELQQGMSERALRRQETNYTWLQVCKRYQDSLEVLARCS
ncbi:glycosyltransferase [Rhodococcus sp. BH2-1]|nr:glycosyltransferase [Rhodococcus sp. BH2-1]